MWRKCSYGVTICLFLVLKLLFFAENHHVQEVKSCYFQLQHCNGQLLIIQGEAPLFRPAIKYSCTGAMIGHGFLAINCVCL